MSSIWTPGGERPVGRTDAATEVEDEALDHEPTQEELEELTRQLASTPAWVVVTNHAMGLFELARLHLSQQPPNLAEASVAIDAMGSLVEGLEGRLGEAEATLKDGLAQLRVAFVQLRASLSEPPPTEG